MAQPEPLPLNAFMDRPDDVSAGVCSPILTPSPPCLRRVLGMPFPWTWLAWSLYNKEFSVLPASGPTEPSVCGGCEA